MESDDQEYVEPGTGVMVSNLPLLFARGRPTSLHQMNLAELEVFVPFMVQCSVGEERPVPWSQLPRPSWWPRKLPFRMPSASSASATRIALLDLVERCYTYHGCEYLLQFCDSLTVQMPSSGYRFNDNRDGTTSMYHGCTGKLLVTFRNENRDYDKHLHEGRSVQKKLLLSPSAHTERRGSNGTAMFQPPVSDIYLCDKCENEFYSLREVQIHEKQCRGDTNSSSQVPSPEPDPIDDEPEPAGQVPFLAYFSLQPAEHTGIKPYMSPRKRSVPSPPRKLFGPTYPRYDSIALSSPLGKFLLANSKFRNKVQATQHLVMKYERNLRASPNMEIVSGRERCLNRWIVVWRASKEAQPWIHKYCFNRSQRQEQKLTIATGVNRRSRHLLRRCRPCNVKVKRLQKRLVDRYKRLGGPSAPCIDLTDESQALPMQLPFPMLVNNFDRSLEHLALLHSPQSKVNLGASSSYVSTSSNSNSWASTSSHHIPGIPFFQDGGRPFDIQPDNLLRALSNPGYYVFDEKGSRNAKPVADERRWKQEEYPASSVSAAKPGSRSHHRKNSERLNSSLPLNISESRNSPVIKKEGLFNTRKEHSSNSHSGLEAGKDYKPNTEAKVGVVPSRFYSNNSVVVSNSGEVVNSWPYQSVPHVFESMNNSLLVDSANVSVSRTSSSIEIIDLSSDDDETVKGRSQNEADNAPQQLDGFHCYPHSGAKIPFSSKNSLPKNGNSHWSSVQKSHCGAGHLGDLATNGQPPNVPPNLPVSPVPDRVFSPITKTSVTPSTSGNKKNYYRRKHRKSVVDRKMNVDDSQKDTSLSTEYEILNKDSSDNDEQHPKLRSGTLTGTSLVDGETFPDALTGETHSFSDDSVCQDPHGLVIDNEISFKPPLQVDEDISFNISQRHGSGKHKESASGFEDPSQEKRLQSVGAPMVGFISNIVNTVNRGVEFFKALVGGNSGDNFVNDKDTQPTASSKEEVEQMSNQYNTSLLESEFDKKSRKRKSREMDNLLQDECLELRQRGLGDLTHLDIQDARLTRRSVERYIPRKVRRREIRRQRNLGRRQLNVSCDTAEKITRKRGDSDFSFSKREKIDFVKRRKDPDVEESKDPEMDSDSKDAKYSEVQCASEANKIPAANITTPSFVPSLNELSMLEDCIDENGNSPTYSDISSVFEGERAKGVDCNYNNEIGDSKPLMASNKSEGIDQEVHKAYKAECISTEKLWNDSENKDTSVLKTSKETSSNPSKGTRELKNLANDEWKEMVTKGFHPLSIVKPALMKKARLQQRENLNTKRTQKTSMLEEFPSAVPGDGDFSRTDSRPTEIYSQENMHCAYNSHLGKKDVKVECPLANSNITSSCMGETAEEHGALLAEIPGAEAHSEPISNSISKCSLSYKASVSFGKDKYSDLVSNPLSTDSSITEDKSSLNSRQRSKKMKKRKSKCLSRELYNLVGDEWKEMRGKGFHPSDLLGTCDGNVEYMDNGADGESIQESKPCQKNKIAADESSKKTKLSRELVRLLKDECKELQPLDLRGRKGKKSKSKKILQPFGLKRLQEAYSSADVSTRQRSSFQNVPLVSTCIQKNGSYRMAENIYRLEGTKLQLTRNTRSQTNVLSNVEVFTPRSSHREILQTELAMCVLNYNLPTII